MKLLMIIAGLLFAYQTSAQKLYKDYTFYPQETGTLYFIFPQKGFKSSQPSHPKGLEYDITYFTANDSVTFTYTYLSKNVCPTDSLSFISPGCSTHTAKAEMLFVEPLKGLWRQRATVKIPCSLIISFYKNEAPYSLVIHSHGQRTDYTLPGSRWKKQQRLISRVFEMIHYNKQ